MNKKFLSKVFFISLISAAVAAGIFLYHFLHPSKPALLEQSLKSATLLKQPRSLTSFSLQDMQENAFTQDSLKGHWSLIFFGFTHCPSICPTALANLNQVYQKLEKKGLSKRLNVIFVSVDPQKDRPKVLQRFLSHFNPNFLGITGNEDQINQFAKDLGAVYMETEGEGADAVATIDHSATVFVTNPQGHFYALFSSPDEVDKIAEDLQKIIQ